VTLNQALASFILRADFPCIGAKASLAQGGLTTMIARDIQSSADDQAIHGALLMQAKTIDGNENALASFAVIYEHQNNLDECSFEHALWQRLAGLMAIDAACGIPWCSTASRDVTAPNYAMSVGNNAYFVIGLHPNASRFARRFSHCAMVFNAHKQFDEMRADGRYQRFQAINRARELSSYGSLNPMLADFGKTSEAPQYSGRFVEKTWICPMHKGTTHA
jgi:uncharacterized protein